MRLDVLHISQELKNSCWHASARMLYGYRRKACIHPLPKTWDSNQGLAASDFIVLAMALGLKTMPMVRQTYGVKFVEDALRSYGPLWAAGQWNGVNHIVVISGIDPQGTMYVNDPAFPSPVIRDIGWFNDRIDKNVEIPLMYLP